MTTAVFLIVFVAFAARVVQSAVAIRNAFLAVAIALVAIGGYVGGRIWVSTARPPMLVLSVLMLAVGFGIPTLLMNAETKGRLARGAALFAGALAAAVAADVWRITGGLGKPFFLDPQVWFAVGVACFLIFKARFFEDVLSAD